MDKREFLKTMTTAAVAAPVAAATAAFIKSPAQNNDKPSAYQRVMKKGLLRAGSFEEPPFTYYDVKTGKRSGIAVTLAEKILDGVNLKLEWVAANFSSFVDDLETTHYDAICASVFLLPRAGRIDYATPYAYVPVHGYVRTDETRFGSELMQLNDPRYIVSSIEGEGIAIVAHQKFPRARFLDLPANASLAESLLNVVQHKADVAFVMPAMFAEFDKNNPGLMKPIASEEALQIFAVAFAFRPGEEALKSLFNNNLQRMIVSGEMDDIFGEFDPNHYLLRPGIRYAGQK